MHLAECDAWERAVDSVLWGAAGGFDPSEVLRLAAAVEAATRHPVADAVLAAARQTGDSSLLMPSVCNLHSKSVIAALSADSSTNCLVQMSHETQVFKSTCTYFTMQSF